MEAIYNPNFNSVEFDGFKNKAGLHTFILSVTDSNNPRNYWNMLKKRMSGEEKSELYTKCVQLKLKSKDGKMFYKKELEKYLDE